MVRRAFLSLIPGSYDGGGPSAGRRAKRDALSGFTCPPGGPGAGGAGRRTAAGSRCLPAAAFLDPGRDRLRVGPGLAAQPGALPCERLVQLPLGRALQDPGHLKAGVTHWAGKAGHANLRWQDNTYTHAAISDSGELLYAIVPTAVRQDSDPEP